MEWQLPCPFANLHCPAKAPTSPATPQHRPSVAAARCGRCPVWLVLGMAGARCGRCPVWLVLGMADALRGGCPVWPLPSVAAGQCGRCLVWRLPGVATAQYGRCPVWPPPRASSLAHAGSVAATCRAHVWGQRQCGGTGAGTPGTHLERAEERRGVVIEQRGIRWAVEDPSEALKLPEVQAAPARGKRHRQGGDEVHGALWRTLRNRSNCPRSKLRLQEGSGTGKEATRHIVACASMPGTRVKKTSTGKS
eukprot:362191-Chlamydomonas_euryale.AAC.8